MVTLKTAFIFAKDLERLQRFYTDGFGFVPVEQSPGWVSFGAGGAAFALHAIPAEIAASIEVKSPPVAREETPVKLVFQTDGELAALCAKLAAAGAVMFEPRHGGCDGLDPEGNVFRIEKSEIA